MRRPIRRKPNARASASTAVFARLSELSGLLPFLLLLLMVGVRPAAAEGAAELVHIRSAFVAIGEGDAGFPEAATPEVVALPDEWSRTRPELSGALWYRVAVQPTASSLRGELQALYIERVCSNFEVRLNRQLIHSGGPMREPVAHHCGQPQLVTLPAALIRPGGSLIDIHVVGHSLAEVGSWHRAGALSDLVFGPHAVLAPRQARQAALAVGFAQGASAVLLLMGGFMLALGYLHRGERHLAYFGALCVGLALFDARLWLTLLPIRHAAAEFGLLVLLGMVTWATVQFLLRAQGARLRLADTGLPLQCAAVALSLLLAGPQRLHGMALAWYTVFALEIALAAAYHLRLRSPAGPWWPAAVVGAGVALLVLADLLSPWVGSLGRLTQLPETLLPLVLVFVGLRLVLQQSRARKEADKAEQVRQQLAQVQLEMEQRVRDATAEVERNMRQIADVQVEKVTERERKRIAADLHDDLGAKLLTIVHTSESDRISTLAREALEEMRLSVRGLTGRPVRLADALGDWRAETVSRLGQAGIEGEWHAPEEMPQMLSSRAYVQTTRILREATNNIIKHSGASHCSVRCGIAQGDFQLVIQDNGNGISHETVDARLDRGHGLASMKNRAKQLQGQCLVESGPGHGTVIRLTLPLDRATGAS